jgi:hypothetical protein
MLELESETQDAIAHFSGANQGPLEILLKQAQDEHVHAHRREIYDSWMREQLKVAHAQAHARAYARAPITNLSSRGTSRRVPFSSGMSTRTSTQ